MSRFVVPKKLGLAAGTEEPSDGFAGRLTKYLPVPIVGMYTAAIGMLTSITINPVYAPWIATGLIAIFCVGTVLDCARNAPSGNVRKAHLIASPIAFLAWAYPLASPLLGSWFIGWISVIGQAIAALTAYLLEPKE